MSKDRTSDFFASNSRVYMNAKKYLDEKKSNFLENNYHVVCFVPAKRRLGSRRKSAFCSPLSATSSPN